MKLVDYIEHLQVLINPAAYKISVCTQIRKQDTLKEYYCNTDHPAYNSNDVIFRDFFLEIEGDYDTIINIAKDLDTDVVLEHMSWYMDEEDAKNITRYDDIEAMKNMPANAEVSFLVDNLTVSFYIPDDSESLPEVEHHDDPNDYSVDDINHLFSNLAYPICGIKFVVFDSNKNVFKNNNFLDTKMFKSVCAQVKLSTVRYMNHLEGCFNDYRVEAVIPQIISNNDSLYLYKNNYVIVYLIKK